MNRRSFFRTLTGLAAVMVLPAAKVSGVAGLLFGGFETIHGPITYEIVKVDNPNNRGSALTFGCNHQLFEVMTGNLDKLGQLNGVVRQGGASPLEEH